MNFWTGCLLTWQLGRVELSCEFDILIRDFQGGIALGDLFREFVRLAGIRTAERSFALHVLIDVEALLIRIFRCAPVFRLFARACLCCKRCVRRT